MKIDMNSVNAAQTVFSLFYAIFWGALANVWPKWKAFDWSLLVEASERSYARRRCVLSVALLNIVPILFFVPVFAHLGGWNSDCPQWLVWLRLMVCMLQPFVLIGLYWLWVAVVQRHRSKFYPAPLPQERYTAIREVDLNSKFAGINARVALLYILVPPAALIAVSYLCP
jgi:hypothetical protein